MASQAQSSSSGLPEHNKLKSGELKTQSFDKDTGMTDRWWGSRSSLMVLISVILVLGAIGMMYLSEHYDYFGLKLLKPVADAMMVVSVTVLLTELGPFRTYIEERLQVLKQVLDRPVFERLTDANYLRENFKPSLVQALKRASTCASLPANIRDYPEFLSIIDKYVMPLAEETVWRKDFHLSLTHRLLEKNGQTVVHQKSTLSSTYINTAKEERIITIPIVHERSKLPDVPVKDLCSECWAKVKIGSNGGENYVPLIFKQTDLGDSMRFESSVNISVGQQPVYVSTGHETVLRPNDTLKLAFTVPTTGLSVTYQHPPEIKPELYCFNVGGTLNPIVSESTLHQWEHDGTFLPDHGAVLTYSLVRRKMERRVAEKVAGEKGRLAS